MRRSIEDTSIVFIGAGNLATNLAKALYDNGFRIIQVYSRTEESARALAQVVEATYTTDVGFAWLLQADRIEPYVSEYYQLRVGIRHGRDEMEFGTKGYDGV